MNETVVAGVLFLLTYVFVVAFKRAKSQILWIAIVGSLVLGLTRSGDFLHDINWNVMGIFAGTLLISEYFILSRVPDAVAMLLIRHTHTVGLAYLAVCLLASFLSIFIENVATVLIVAPIMIGLSHRVGVSPVPGVIGIAIASNLQGAATLIGDPPSMILANYMRMNFNDFFVYQGKPSMFFAVQIGAIGSMLFLFWRFRRYKGSMEYEGHSTIRSWAPTACLVLMVAALVMSSHIDPDFEWFGGTACMAAALLCILVSRFAHRPEHRWVWRHYDWETTTFLAGIFVIVGMLERWGVVDVIADFLAVHIPSNPLIAFSVVVWVSVALSAFIDNVPYLTAMIPVVQRLSDSLFVPVELLVFGLLIGASLGGNITPIGAAANIVAVGALRKRDFSVSFREFVGIGLPFTVIATLLGSIFVYLIWG